jgi:hypothetical protein
MPRISNDLPALLWAAAGAAIATVTLPPMAGMCPGPIFVNVGEGKV